MKRSKHFTEARLVPGTIVMIDLDNFEQVTQTLGLDEYKPNFATGELTNLIESFANRKRGVIIHGLDPERGTEEAVIEIPYTTPEEVIKDLKMIMEKLSSLGVKATIAVSEGMVSARPALNPKEAFKGTPWRQSVYKMLRKAKRKGGGRLIVLGGQSV